ncbi:MAG: YIP1 family protein [Oscillospiraceae bacterium]|nr:YIP1 family protein [Oscillospiraceae bacterium]
MSKYFTKEKMHYYRRIFTNPLDSFYEIRYREHGSIPVALICVLMFGLVFTMNRIFANFIVNDIDPRTVNGLTEIGAVFMMFLLFCIGNWSVTCLMDGEGRLKDIVTVTGYSLTPLIAVYIPATLLSHAVAAGEEIFYYFALAFGIGWTAVLVLMGIMTVHNYNLLKTLITLVFTFFAMFVFIFLAMLIFDLINQVIIFIRSIYTELIFRY